MKVKFFIAGITHLASVETSPNANLPRIGEHILLFHAGAGRDVYYQITNVIHNWTGNSPGVQINIHEVALPTIGG